MRRNRASPAGERAERAATGTGQYDFGGDAGVVERFVSNLRRKSDFGGPSLIHTVRGFGYSLRPVRR